MLCNNIMISFHFQDLEFIEKLNHNKNLEKNFFVVEKSIRKWILIPFDNIKLSIFSVTGPILTLIYQTLKFTCNFHPP